MHILEFYDVYCFKFLYFLLIIANLTLYVLHIFITLILMNGVNKIYLYAEFFIDI
jgi:hypothetical protein